MNLSIGLLTTYLPIVAAILFVLCYPKSWYPKRWDHPGTEETSIVGVVAILGGWGGSTGLLVMHHAFKQDVPVGVVLFLGFFTLLFPLWAAGVVALVGMKKEAAFFAPLVHIEAEESTPSQVLLPIPSLSADALEEYSRSSGEADTLPLGEPQPGLWPYRQVSLE